MAHFFLTANSIHTSGVTVVFTNATSGEGSHHQTQEYSRLFRKVSEFSQITLESRKHSIRGEATCH
jgi:hypothetical protein